MHNLSIWSMTETSAIVLDESSSTDNNYISCISNMKYSLLIHFVVTSLFFLFVTSYLSILCTILFFSNNRTCRRVARVLMYTNLPVPYEENDLSYLIVLLKKEIQMIFVYVIASFIYTLFGLANANYSITYMNLLFWLVEASYAPLGFLLSIPLCFIAFPLNLYSLSPYNIIWLQKVFFFVFMRYSESQPDSYLNCFRKAIFTHICSVTSTRHAQID